MFNSPDICTLNHKLALNSPTEGMSEGEKVAELHFYHDKTKSDLIPIVQRNEDQRMNLNNTNKNMFIRG